MAVWIDAPANTTIACDKLETLTASYLNYSNDALGGCLIEGEVLGVISGELNNVCEDQLTQTWTFIDDCGRTITNTQTITVIDTTAPEITSAQSVVVACDAEGNQAQYEAWLANHGGATAIDGCSEVTWSNNSEGLVPGCGTTASATVTFIATDACGNADSTTATFSIVDNTPPVITRGASALTVDCDGEGNLAQLQTWLDNHGGALATDNCGEVSWQNNYQFAEFETTCCNSGSVRVEFYAFDDCGNFALTIGTFTITDDQAPIFTVPADTIISSGENCQYNASVEVTGNVTDATDNCCDEVTVNFTDEVEQGNCAGEWIISRTWAVSDACGNTATQVQTITIIDNTAPTAVCKDLTVQLDSFGVATITAADLDGGSSDNCGIDTMFISQYDFTCDYLGNNNVTLTVVDNCGNTSTCEATVTVEAGEADCGNIPLQAEPDSLVVTECPNSEVTWQYNLLANDHGIGSEGVTMTIDNLPENVTVDLATGELNFFTDEIQDLTLEFNYTICSNANPENCSSATVKIIIMLDSDCDGVADAIDIDDDDDGILDIDEELYALNKTTLDSDGDGIVDRLDIDSDNDGIPDNIEWQQTIAEGQEAARRGGTDNGYKYYPPLGTDSNGNGWDDQYDTENEGVYYEPLDIDQDGTPDYLDTDSDGDNIPDWIEGWDAAPHDTIADVTIGDTDSDGDGLYDPYDSYDTSNEWLHGRNAIGSNAPLQDSDTIIGVRDWRDEYVVHGGGQQTEGCELDIPDGFSPNGDNYNDYFEIRFTCAQGEQLFEDIYPDAKIEIYNRWGNLINKKENYGNISRWGSYEAWWDGTSTNGMQVGSDKLPAATYFYILYLNDESNTVVTGSVYLNK